MNLIHESEFAENFVVVCEFIMLLMQLGIFKQYCDIINKEENGLSI